MSAPFCVHCASGFALEGTPKGTMEKLGPYDTYIASPSSVQGEPGRAIFFACDAFGLSLINNKIIPDILAERLGVPVYVPDYFEGKGVEPTRLQMPSTAKEMRSQSLMQKVTSGLGMLSIAPWFISNRPGTKIAPLEKWFTAVEEAKGVKEWASTSYCFGGKPVLHFASQSKFKANVLCHPSFVAIDDIKKMKGTSLFICADEDPVFGASLREQSQQVLKERQDKGEIQAEFKFFHNTVHGFCARPDFSVPEVKKAFEDATQLTVEWLKEHFLQAKAEGKGTAGGEPPAATAAPV
ncbi:hypothetical protein BDZ90DRAFT_278431 [Jaminaea rosea]|uniref:Dienelactone hydrolase domain-containing protein n=1 Tax=Jaminaea rosea TaxID=1569628 RepID=A0A316UUQ0_9BASI|nr:hypothetical protein BDZ90DRAFT_278431 [Jaminaea rosea]PWN29036.1 hypothetical protein BDZ90DRAFT_278431 [Jaminaea rosea]